MKKSAYVIAAVLFLIPALWFIAIPESLISDLIESALDRDYFYLRTEGVKKGSFYNFSAGSITIMKRNPATGIDNALLVFHDLQGRLEFSSLFRLNPELSFKGRMNSGDIRGLLRTAGKDRLTISGADIPINGIPLLKPVGIYGEGILSGTFILQGNTGDLKFSVRDARLKSTSLGGVFLPLDLFHEIRGAAIMNGDSVEVKSLAMTGTGIYARVKGGMRGDNLDFSLELMTDSMFGSETILLAFLEKYRVSPGYYVVPLKGLLRGKG